MKNKNISIPTSVNLKYQISLLLILLFFVSSIKAQDMTATPKENVTNLCYDKEYTERMRVVGDLDIEQLTTVEKLQFIKKTNRTHHESKVNSSGEVVFEITTISHQNMYPKWYVPAIKTRIDNNGIKSYYNDGNKLIPGGWAGSKGKTTEHGEYVTDKRSGQKYFTQNHTQKSETKHAQTTSIISEKGLLFKFVYPQLTEEMTNQFVRNGFELIREESTTVLKNSDVIIVWDDARKTVITQVIENENIKKTVTCYYKYDELFQEEILVNEVEVVPSTFDNGDCYEAIYRTKYTNYSSCQ